MKRLLIIFCQICMLTIFTFSGVAQEAQMPSQINQLINDQFTPAGENEVLIVGIIHKDKAILKQYGSEQESQTDLNIAHKLFELGAISEVFTTSLMIQASYENKLNLTDRVKDYLPSSYFVPSFDPVVCIEELPHGDEGIDYRPIQICESVPFSVNKCIGFCDLASHTAGLPNVPRGAFDWNPFKYLKHYKDPFQTLDREKLFSLLKNVHLNVEPGRLYQHSGWGISILGQTLVEIYQQPYSILLKEKLLKPLNMMETYIQVPDSKENNYLTGYNRRGELVSHQHFNAMSPALGIKSTATDLTTFLKAQINAKKQTDRIIEAMSSTHDPKIRIRKKIHGKSVEGGYGWFISPLDSDLNVPIVWKNGGTTGFNAFVGFVKPSQTGVFILTNSEQRITKLGFDIIELLNESFL